MFDTDEEREWACIQMAEQAATLDNDLFRAALDVLPSEQFLSVASVMGSKVLGVELGLDACLASDPPAQLDDLTYHPLPADRHTVVTKLSKRLKQWELMKAAHTGLTKQDTERISATLTDVAELGNGTNSHLHQYYLKQE